MDGDGRQELIFNFNTSNMAGMCEVVYGYDEKSGHVREEFAEWVDTAYYGNGLIKVSASHNHGKDPEERGIWPYSLYQYEEGTDSYRLQYYVESWDRQASPENFPAKLDTDGDGILYYIMEGTETVENTDAAPVDREAYDSWAEETMPEWNKINVTYHPMTEEEIGRIGEAYEQAAAYAAHTDQWISVWQKKHDYICRRTSISAKPSRFCPFHLRMSNLSSSDMPSPIPQILSITAHSARTVFPVASSSFLKSSFWLNFSIRPLYTII